MANNGLVVRFFADTRSAVADIGKLERSIGRSATAGEKWRKSGIRMAGAIGVVAAAAGALAVKVGVDAVQAAMAEQAELTKLNRTLGNLGFASAADEVNKFVDDMQYMVAFTDSDMRSALQKLLIATGDVTKAQAAMGNTFDLAAYRGVSAEEAATALAKAFAGNTKSLKTMVPGMDAAILKSGDMNKIMAELARVVGGQASEAADTMQGKMKILSNAVSELQESFGMGMMQGFLDALSNGSGDIEKASDGLRDMQDNTEKIGETIGTFLAGAANGAALFIDVVKSVGIEAYYRFTQASLGAKMLQLEVLDFFGRITDEEAELERTRLLNEWGRNEAVYTEGILALHVKDTADATSAAAKEAVNYNAGLNGMAGAAGKAKTELQRLQEEMDKFAKNRSIAGQKIALAEMRQEGPGKSGERKGPDGKVIRFSTRRDLRKYGLEYADQASRFATEVAERGGFSEKSKRRARRILANAREYLAGQGLGGNFTDANGAYLGTPDALDPSRNKRRGRRVGDYEAQKMGYPGGTTINIDKVEVAAETPAQAVQQAKQWIRLAAVGRGPANDGSRPDVTGTTRRPPGGAGG